MDPGFPYMAVSMRLSEELITLRIHNTLAMAELLGKSRGMGRWAGGVPTVYCPLQKTVTWLTTLPDLLPFASAVPLLAVTVHRAGKAGNTSGMLLLSIARM